MNEVRIPTLLIHVGVILERNFACHFLKEDEEQQGKYGREEYEISRHFLKKSALDCLYKFGRQRSVILPFIWNMEKEKDIVKKNSYKD